MRQHPGRAVTSWQVAELFGSAYCKAASVGTAVSGFRASGLWPLNIGVFSDCDFAASAVTDICSISESGVSDLVAAELIVPTPPNRPGTDSQAVDDGDVNHVAAVPVDDAEFHTAAVSTEVISEPAALADITVAQQPDPDRPTTASPDVSSGRIGVFSDCNIEASAVTDICSIGDSDLVAAELTVPTPPTRPGTDSQTVDDGDVNHEAAVPVDDAQSAAVSTDVIGEPAAVYNITVAQQPDPDRPTTASSDVSSGRPTTTEPVPTGRFYKTPRSKLSKVHEAPNVVAFSDRTIHSVHVSDISPTPVMKESQSCRRKRRADHAADVTSTPYKKALENTPSGKKAIAKKRLLLAEQASSNIKQGNLPASTVVQNRKTKSKDSAPKDSVHGSATKKRKTSGRRTQQKQKTIDSTGDIWICHDCNVEYGDKNDTRLTEDWITCATCAKCFHMSCAENNGIVDDDESFVCKDCL